MDEVTLLDQTFAAMEAAPDDNAARLRYYERLIDAELFLLLSDEGTGDTLSPQIFETEEGQFVLVFDREERLTAFIGDVAPYAALSGRSLIPMLAGKNIGLGINLEVTSCQFLLPAAAVDWIKETLSEHAVEAERHPEEVGPPAGLPEVLLSSLDAKLASAAGLSDQAYLVLATYEDQARNHLLVFVDAKEGAKPALVDAVKEAVIFSGIEAGSLDVGFCRAADALAPKLARVGLRFDLPQPEIASAQVQTAPGSDPNKPPILK